MKEMILKAVAGFLLLLAGTLMRMIRPLPAEEESKAASASDFREAA